MTDLAQLYKLGKTLEKSGAELEAWVEEKYRAITADKERLAQIDADKCIRIEMERGKLELEKDKERTKEKSRLELAKIDLEKEKARIEMEKEIELKRLEVNKKSTQAEQVEAPPTTTNSSRSMLYKMPKFEDKKDDIDAFIRRFETIAKSENIADNMMSQHLLTLVGGRGLDACHTLTDEEIKDYKTLKKTLLEFYHLTEETYRQKFHQLQPNKNEDFKVFTNDLKLTLKNGLRQHLLTKLMKIYSNSSWSTKY